MSSTTLADDLRAMLRGEVHTDTGTLAAYSRDASIFTVTPEVVVAPKDVSDLKKLVLYASGAAERGNPVALTARAAGTDMTGGPLGESIVLDFTKHFTRVGEIGDCRAEVEPGVYYRDFERRTLAHDLIMPSYPASKNLCAIGGMVANNAGGEKTLFYGKTADYVESLDVVLADGNEYTFGKISAEELAQKKRQKNFEGEVYRGMHTLLTDHADAIAAARPDVSKNSSGYALWDVYDPATGTFDLTRLFVGSQGTLGLITTVRFRLVHPRPHRALLVVFLDDMQQLATVTSQLLAHAPETLESYDDHTFSLAVKLFPAMIKRMKGSFLSLAWRFIPEAWAIVTGGVPKLVLLAEFTSGESREAAAAKAQAAQSCLRTFGVRTRIAESRAEIEKFWVIRRESFNLLRHHVHGLKAAPFIDDIVVKPAHLPAYLPRLYEILDEYDITYTIAGHVGDGNFHIIPLMDLTEPDVRETIYEITDRVSKLTAEFVGSMSGEHNDGLIRTPYLALMFGEEIVARFAEVKALFDPHNIFNPHKKVGGTRAYAQAHFAYEDGARP